MTKKEIEKKIKKKKKNNFITNLNNETRDVQNIIRSFYKCEKTYRRDTNKLKDNDFWFRLTFCNYQVTDKLVREINREYKRFQIKNIGKDEF